MNDNLNETQRPHINQFLIVIDECYLKPAIEKASWNEDPNTVLIKSDFEPLMVMPKETFIEERQSNLIINGKRSKMSSTVKVTPRGVSLVNTYFLPTPKRNVPQR